MKTVSLFFVLCVLFVIGCSKDEPKVEQTADSTASQPHSQMLSLEMLPPHVRAGIASIDKQKLRTHALAAQVYINLPDSAMPVPIPPPLRPFKDPKLREANDSTAIYIFTAANGKPGEMLLHRIVEGSDTIWIPLHILPR